MALTESLPHAGGFILSEVGFISREAVVLVSGAGALKAGTVLGKITASGKYKAYDNDAVDGTEVARAVLFQDTDATSADTEATVVARLAEVISAKLIWGAGVTTQGEKDAALVDLAAAYIIAR